MEEQARSSPIDPTLEHFQGLNRALENVPVQELYTKAANAKRSLNRSKKDLQMGLKALQEVPSSSYFFDQLVHY